MTFLLATPRWPAPRPFPLPGPPPLASTPHPPGSFLPGLPEPPPPQMSWSGDKVVPKGGGRAWLHGRTWSPGPSLKGQAFTREMGTEAQVQEERVRKPRLREDQSLT